MIPGKRYTPEDVLRAGWRRRWWIVLPAVVATIVAIYLSLTSAPRFQAEALIQVVSGVVAPTGILPDNEDNSLRSQGRLLSISRQMLTRPRLQQIIEDLNLYAAMRKTHPMEQVIERMRDGDMMFEVVDREIFKIGYRAGSPQLAHDVTQRLTALFLQESSRSREGLAEATETFLESQLVDAKKRLEDQEQKLREYQERYSGELPSQQATNVQVLTNNQMQLQQLADALNRDRDQRLFLQQQLDRARTDPLSVSAGVDGSLIPGVGVGSAAQQLETARAELRAMELHLTPQHPDILQAKANIAKLEKKAEMEARSGGLSGARTPAEALRQSRMRDLQSQIQLVDRQIANKAKEQDQLRTSSAEYRRRLDAVPLHEAELTALTRDYDTLKKLYSDLLDRKEKAKMAANLERKEVGERFKVLDPARVPEKRISPNRTMMTLIGFAAGLVLGIALAALIEVRDSSLRSDDDVEASLGLPVLAVVPTVGMSGGHVTGRMRTFEMLDTALLRLAAAMIGGAALMSFAAAFIWTWVSGR